MSRKPLSRQRQNTRDRSHRHVINTSMGGEDGPPRPVVGFDDDSKLHGIQERLNVLDELLNTERDYLADLCVVVDNYMIPLLAQQLVTNDQARLVFSNIDQLRDVHMSLFAELEAKISDIEFAQCIEHCITEIFEAAVPQLRTYVNYSIGYAQAIKQLAKLKAGSPPFAAFIEKTEGEDEKKLRLQDYLIKPVQRLCKYPLMFKQLLKHTADDHEDHAYMTSIMNQLKEVTEHVEECNQKAEKERICMELYNNLPGFPSEEMDTTREVVKRGDVQIQAGKDSAKARHLLLFEDLLLVAKLKNKKGQHVVSTVVKVASLLISADDSLGPKTPTGSRRLLKKRGSESQLGGTPCVFQLVDMQSKKKYTITLPDAASRDEWMRTMERCISDLHSSAGRQLLLPSSTPQSASKASPNSQSLGEVKRPSRRTPLKASNLAHVSGPSRSHSQQTMGSVSAASGGADGNGDESSLLNRSSSPVLRAPKPAILCMSPRSESNVFSSSSSESALSPRRSSDGSPGKKLKKKKKKPRSGEAEDDKHAEGGDDDEVSKLKAELSTERAKRRAAEVKVSYLENKLAALQAEVDSMRAQGDQS